MSDHTPETTAIQLTRGQETIIDVIDSDLAEYNWYALKRRNHAYDAVRGIPNPDWKHQKLEYLARVILSRKIERPLEYHEKADHINNNPLDNRRENLRLATVGQNNHNARRRKDNTSGFKGVSWGKREKKWVVHISIEGKSKYLGQFDDLQEAREAYKTASIKYHGEFARFE
jgi:hypothetical protein